MKGHRTEEVEVLRECCKEGRFGESYTDCEGRRKVGEQQHHGGKPLRIVQKMGN